MRICSFPLLEVEGFGQIANLVRFERDFRITKTNNRRTLGAMNDLKQQLEARIHLAGGIHLVSERAISRDLNEIPWLFMKPHCIAREAFAAKLAGCT